MQEPARYVEAQRDTIAFERFELDGLIGSEHAAGTAWAKVEQVGLLELYAAIQARIRRDFRRRTLGWCLRRDCTPASRAWAALASSSGSPRSIMNSGNDVLDGKAGADTTTGGAGNDTCLYRQRR